MKKQENIDIICPALSFREVIEKYGWVYPSKEVAESVYYAKKGSVWAVNKLKGLNRYGELSRYKSIYKKWAFLLDAPFEVNKTCCTVMKKNPVHKYEKEHKLYGIVGTLAEESKLRENGWMRSGCNTLEKGKYKSRPLSFWTTHDILKYIVDNNLEYCSVYGDIVLKNGKYRTTGERQTGCVFCLCGSHLDNPPKFKKLKETHPRLYDYCLYQLGIKEILDYIGEHLGKELY